MGDTILLFESRDLCYESNRYFMECMADAFEQAGYPVEICDLSACMEEKLEAILKRREQFLAGFDFNSLLPRLELEDGTPYLTALGVPFYNYLVDHPLYHHIGIKNSFPGYSVICIDTCHQSYVRKYYPHIGQVLYLPLGAMKADMERSFCQKRLELLFLGTYEPEENLYLELSDYPDGQRREIAALIDMMGADHELTQEEALMRYLKDQKQEISPEQFIRKMNADYLADKYLRNKRRKDAVSAAAKAGVSFTIIGQGWELAKGLEGPPVQIRQGIGFAASVQMIANAKMLLNVTPGFCGGMHDRVYSAMINRTLCLTEKSGFSQKILLDKEEAVLYDSAKPHTLAEAVSSLQKQPERIEAITQRAYQKAAERHTWANRVSQIIKSLSCRTGYNLL